MSGSSHELRHYSSARNVRWVMLSFAPSSKQRGKSLQACLCFTLWENSMQYYPAWLCLSGSGGTWSQSLKSKCPGFNPLLYSILCCLDGWELMVAIWTESSAWFAYVIFRGKFRSRTFPLETELFSLGLHFSNSCSTTFASSLKIEWWMLLYICEIRVYGIVIQQKWRHVSLLEGRLIPDKCCLS